MAGHCSVCRTQTPAKDCTYEKIFVLNWQRNAFYIVSRECLSFIKTFRNTFLTGLPVLSPLIQTCIMNNTANLLGIHAWCQASHLQVDSEICKINLNLYINLTIRNFQEVELWHNYRINNINQVYILLLVVSLIGNDCLILKDPRLFLCCQLLVQGASLNLIFFFYQCSTSLHKPLA